MRVIVYVEGPSDQKALEALLRPIVETARARRIGMSFSPLRGKGAILDDVPRKAAEILKASPEDWVFALPDLYPLEANGPRRHKSFPELDALLRRLFVSRADEIGVPAPARSHFRVHCLKHDLEALLLASPNELRRRLGTTDNLDGRWRRPVEDQNNRKPPKYVVTDLFRQYRRRTEYVDTVDAAWILERASLASIEAACKQNFAPFVRELRSLAEVGELDVTRGP